MMPEGDGKTYIDWNDGIKRVMNNVKLYTRLLEKFKTSAAANLGNLSAALDAGDFEKAQSEAHTIKGVAANLSLLALQEGALELETQIKARAVAPGAFDGLKACFAETLTAIDQTLAAHG
jgi:HPt (histidine-containing phosphotransfer) domain-containing protein